MKRLILVLAVLAVIVFLGIISANAEDEYVTVTWKSGEAAYFIGASGEYTEQTMRFRTGHVITSEDLPTVYSYAQTSDKYHSEWTGAVGKALTEDVTFTLNWVSNYDGYKTVIWRSTLLPHYYLLSFDGASSNVSSFFCEIELFKAGHVITSEDIARHSHYDSNVKNQSYTFRWSVSEGVTVTDNTAFLYECEAREAGFVSVIWYNNMPCLGIRLSDDTDERHYVSNQYCLAQVFPIGYTLQSEDLPTLKYYSDEYLYTYVWDGALDTALSGNMYFMLAKVRNEKATVKMYIDSNVVYEETLDTGTKIKLPKTIKGYEDLHIYRWDGKSGAGYIDGTPGENIEVNFDITFDASYVYWGDISHDGTANTRDAVLILRRLAQDGKFNYFERLACDMDENGAVNTHDVTLLLKFVASK